MATYIISDIHGCFDEFQKMLQKIDFSESDRLYLAGDYIDRGKQSLEMLQWLESCPKNVLPIKGNHDAEFVENVNIMRQIDVSEELETDSDSNEDARILLDSVKYMLKGKNAAILEYFDYYGTIEDFLKNNAVTFGELCRWSELLAGYPYCYWFPMKGRDCIVVHAGYCKDAELISDNYGSMEQFYLYAREEGIRIGGVKNGLIVAGHTPTIARETKFYTDGEVFRYYDEEKDCIFYDIDCGCAYYEKNPSATLACLRLEDEEVFYL